MTALTSPDIAYWQARWSRGETGWHLGEVNPHLVRFWEAAGVPTGGAVLVPLCGRSLDLTWLASRGHPVLGVECSAQAAAEYFDQHGLTPTVRRDGPFDLYAGGGVEIAVGDVFDLGALDLSRIAGYYDRAALIALSPEQRARYAGLLCDTLPRTARGLVVALDYPQDEKAGPPFSVPPEEVAALYGARFGLSTLHTADVLSANPGFVAAGVTRLWDHVVHLAPPA